MKSVENAEEILREKKAAYKRPYVGTRKIYLGENFTNIKVSRTKKKHRLN